MHRDSTEILQQGLRRPKGAGNVGNVADWKSIDSVLLQNVVAMASFKGGALRLGYTRDGGAYAIGVYAANEYFTDYVRPGEDIEGYLNSLLESFAEYTPSTGEHKPAAKGNKR
jgi:hypothetical protein